MDHLVVHGALRSLGLRLREPCSLKMFSRDIVSDDGGFTVKHHQQTLFDKTTKKTIELSSVGVFISRRQVCGVRSLTVLAFQAWGGATSLAAELGSPRPPPSSAPEALN